VRIRWSPEAREDVERLADFAAAYDPARANEIEKELSDASRKLLQFSRRGSRLSEFNPSEVREYRAGGYLLRYELTNSEIVVLRFFHAREERGELK
jgi:plasmid stabilization system protein ParE